MEPYNLKCYLFPQLLFGVKLILMKKIAQQILD